MRSVVFFNVSETRMFTRTDFIHVALLNRMHIYARANLQSLLNACALIWLVGQLFTPLSQYLHIGTQNLTWEALYEFYSESPCFTMRLQYGAK